MIGQGEQAADCLAPLSMSLFAHPRTEDCPMRQQKAAAPVWPDLVGGHRDWRVNKWINEWITTTRIFHIDQWEFAATGGYTQ